MSKRQTAGMEERHIALVQLRRAIQLFRQTDFVCAATLAGAAEEILGKIATQRAGYNALDGDVRFAEQLADVLGAARPDAKHVRTVMNRVRNECKHNDAGENDYVQADFQVEAQCLIDRAISNWLIAYGGFPKDRVIARYDTDYWL